MANKAALFGINEYRTVSPLRGCVNDVKNMKELLTGEFGFEPGNVKVTVDGKVTKAEMLKQMKWLYKDVSEGDRVVLHFSGHGSQVADVNGDEDDNADEIFCLVDMDFNDPDTYLLDDELGAWAEQKPPGVLLTIVLDTCHSGTGTRLLISPGKNQAERSMNVDPKATVARATARGADGTRAIGLAGAALDPASDDLVRVRFVDPPPAIKAAIAVRPRRAGRRALVATTTNHVLLAACDATQTAADANLDGQPNGAFTYYLCRTMRDDGSSLDRATLIDRIEAGLRAGHFEQTPQLEQDPSDTGPIFGSPATASTARPSNPTATSTPPGTSTTSGVDAASLLDLIKKIVGGGQGLDAASQKQALEIVAQLVGGARSAAIGRGASDRVLVPVHGICRHVAGYSNPWWESLRPWTNAFGAGTLGDTRREVLWSDLVNQRGLRALDDDALEDERAEFAARVRGALEDRVAREGLREARSAAVSRDLLAPRGDQSSRALSVPGLNCIDDFSVYMFDASVRASIIAEFTKVVRPLLQAGTTIDVLSHSWGTVVAYEGLRQLEDAGFTTRLVRNFFTVGSALSLFPVKQRLLPANRDGRKPANVRRWINIDASGDPVGGALKDQPFQVDEETLGLPNLGCGFFDASCAHSSYFKADNVRVNRDIFARNINSA